MEPSWDDLRLLGTLADAGTMTAAARRLGIGQATMSRRIAALEGLLGHRLVERSRRGIRLTGAGQRLLPHVQAMSASAQRLRAATEAIDVEPRGRVRVAMPPGVAVDVLIPMMQELRATMPLVRIGAVASPFVADLDDDQADLAIRFVKPTGGDLVSRRLGHTSWGIQASAVYVSGLPADAALEDLAWITWPAGAPFVAGRWLREVLPEVDPALEADDFMVQRAAAEAGLGAMVGGHTPTLVPVPVAAPSLPSVDVYLVIRRSLADVPRVRAVADWITRIAQQQLERPR